MKPLSLGQFCALFSNLRRSKLWGTALFGLAIFHLAMQLVVVMPRNLAVTNPEENIAVYYKAAVNAHNGQPIYRKQPSYGPDSEIEAVYIYAPPFAAIISPFAALSFVTFVQLWYCTMFAASGFFAWCPGAAVF